MLASNFNPAPSGLIAEAAAQMAAYNQQAATASRMASGQPEPAPPLPPPPPAPPPAPPAADISPEMVNEVGAKIASLAGPERRRAMLDAHDWLTEQLARSGKFVDPHTHEVTIVRTPQEAETAAQRLINNQLKEQDKALGIGKDEQAKETPASDSSILAARAALQKAQANPPLLPVIAPEAIQTPAASAPTDIPATTPPAIATPAEAQSIPVEAKVEPPQPSFEVLGEEDIPSAKTPAPSGERGQDEAMAKAPVETAGPSAVAETPTSVSSESAAGEAVPQFEVVGEEPKPSAFKKGDEVQLADGRKGTVTFAHSQMSIARVKTIDGKNVTTGFRTLKAAGPEPSQHTEESPESQPRIVPIGDKGRHLVEHKGQAKFFPTKEEAHQFVASAVSGP